MNIDLLCRITVDYVGYLWSSKFGISVIVSKFLRMTIRPSNACVITYAKILLPLFDSEISEAD
jgi:hypothetical protein